MEGRRENAVPHSIGIRNHIKGYKMEGYKEFFTEDETREWGKKYYGEWANNYKKQMRLAKGYTKDEYVLQSIERYCGYNYKQINEGLRNGFDSSGSMYRTLANVLAMVLCSAPRIPSDIVLYRIIDVETMKGILKDNEQYRLSKQKGFLSTSLLKTIVNSGELYARGDVLLKLYVPKGIVGVYVNEVTCRSEEEVLLPPGLYIKLLGEPYKDESFNKTVYECEVQEYRCNSTFICI